MAEQARTGQTQELEKQLLAKQASVGAQIEHLKSLLGFMQQKVQQDKHELERLKKGPQTPEAVQRAAVLEKKLAAFLPILSSVSAIPGMTEKMLSAGSTEAISRMTGQLNAEISWTETEVVLANARQFLVGLSPKIDLLKALTGQKTALAPEYQVLARTIQPRLKKQPSLTQEIHKAIQFFEETVSLLRSEEVEFQELKGLEKREALKRVGSLKTPQLSGKITNLKTLHRLLQAEPELAELFAPAPEVEIPVSSGQTKSKPLTGRLLEMLGITKD